MSRVLDMIWSAILSTWEAVREWLSGVVADPSAWGGLGLGLFIALLVLLLVILLLPSGRRSDRKGEQKPELLVSRGEVRLLEESSVTELDMHVSNLGEGVVQLLEVALSSDLMPTPETVELSVLIPGNRSVDVTLPVEELHGDNGFLDLYFYTPQGRRRAYRLRASLTWEPWNGRFKVEPLEQRVDPARRLASTRLQRRQREEWRRRGEAPDLSEVRASQTQPDLFDDPPEEEERRRERLEFPSDF